MMSKFIASFSRSMRLRTGSGSPFSGKSLGLTFGGLCFWPNCSHRSRFPPAIANVIAALLSSLCSVSLMLPMRPAVPTPRDSFSSLDRHWMSRPWTNGFLSKVPETQQAAMRAFTAANSSAAAAKLEHSKKSYAHTILHNKQTHGYYIIMYKRKYMIFIFI